MTLSSRSAPFVRQSCARSSIWITRMRDADVHDSLAPRAFRGLEKCPRVLDSQFVVDSIMGEPDPIRVVERRGTLEGLHQTNLVIKVEWSNLDGGLRARPPGVSRQCPHSATGIHKCATNGLT